jgi:hypothetical protein
MSFLVLKTKYQNNKPNRKLLHVNYLFVQNKALKRSNLIRVDGYSIKSGLNLTQLFLGCIAEVTYTYDSMLILKLNHGYKIFISNSI